MKLVDWIFLAALLVVMLVILLTPLITMQDKINRCFEQRGLFDGEICYLERVKP